MPEASFPTDILDGFLLGQPISNRNGVKTCPAIYEESNEHYIVKIISLPASQVQVEAMLVSGACSNEEDVASYFRNQASEIIREAQQHTQITQLNQAHPFVKWEVVPMTDGIGCQVILISRYCQTLAQEMSHTSWTRHQAINMALDICSSLSLLRQNGYLYANLKPENIYKNDDGTYLIGDLGGLRVDSIKYTSLPEKYRSAYTAPEIEDIFSPISMNMDVYALGCILYSLFNENILPDDNLTPAKHADYALWHILEKACSHDSTCRWQSPDEFGHALTGYLQQNAAEDKPIVPEYAKADPESNNDILFLTEEENTAQLFDLLLVLPDEEPAVDILDNLLCEDAEALDQPDVSDEDVAQMLSQADNLIEHQPPQPVVAPSVYDVIITLPESPQEDEPTVPIIAEFDPITDADIESEPVIDEGPIEMPVEISDEINEDDEDEDILPGKQPRNKKWLIPLLASVIVLITAIAGALYYQFIYTQQIDNLIVELQSNTATVLIDSTVKDNLLTVECVDTYGNTLRAPVVNGKAVLSGLNSNTLYRIDVVISGVHKLVGNTSHTFTTATNSEIVDFTAICGKIDGSAVLSFSVNGPQSSAWTLTYSASGEKEQSVSFSGTTVTVNGLTAGKEYTFTIAPQDDISVSGQLQLTYVAQNVVIAENLRPTVLSDNKLKVEWDLSANAIVNKWVVRCYNASGYDQTIETNSLFAEFTVPNQTDGYTIFVTAEGMTNTANITITPNPIVITGFQTEVLQDTLHVKWTFEGSTPEESWLVNYCINDGDINTIICDQPSANLELVAGYRYAIRLELASGTTLISNSFEYQA